MNDHGSPMRLDGPSGRANGNPARPLLIVGASTRAAAWSALRAGFLPHCADLYADEDLRATATVVSVGSSLGAFAETLARIPANAPWMYTGGMENRPGLIARLSRGRPLWGMPAATVRALRAAFRKPEIHQLSREHARIPECWAGGQPPPADGTWMLRPRRGSGGRGIVVWQPSRADSSTLREPHWFQRRVTGTPCSALWMGNGREATLVGFMRQWIGEPDWGALGCQYCGSLGPIDVPSAVAADLSRIIGTMTAKHQLRGLFGCDFLLDGSVAWMTEINPRYTASAELYEFATGESLLARHAAIFSHRPEGAEGNRPGCGAVSASGLATGCMGKAILFAPRDLVAPALPMPAGVQALPMLADIPTPGSPIPRGAPICSVFASGGNAEECESQLRERAADWMQFLCGQRGR